MNWRSVELADVLDLQGGFAYKSKDWEVSGIPVLKITNVRNGKVKLAGCSYINEKIAAITSQFVVQKGDLLITLTGEIGATGFYQEDFESRLNQRVGKLVAKNPKLIDLMFLAYFLESPKARSKMWALSKGIAQANISPKEILSLKIPLPPIAEQHQIVEILEDHLSRLDAALADVKQARLKASQFKKSILNDAFTGKLTNSITSKKDFPSGWKKTRLDELAQVQLGRQRSPQHHFGPNMRPYLRAANVTWNGLNISDVVEMNFTDEEMKIYRLEAGDILVNEASGSASEVGKAVIFQGEIKNCGFQNHLIRIRPHSINPEYVFQYLTFNAISGAYVRESQGVGINHLGKAKLASWLVPEPSAEEQERIVKILRESLSRLEHFTSATKVLEQQSKALRRSLLQAAFTGRLTREAPHV